MLNTMPANNPYQQYKKSSIETATPEKLLIMLFDGAIRFSKQAQTAIEKKDFETSNKQLLKVQDILDELIYSLDKEKGGQIAINLSELYCFYKNEVFQANIAKDARRLEYVIEFLQYYREVWLEAMRLVCSGVKNVG